MQTEIQRTNMNILSLPGFQLGVGLSTVSDNKLVCHET